MRFAHLDYVTHIEFFVDFHVPKQVSPASSGRPSVAATLELAEWLAQAQAHRAGQIAQADGTGGAAGADSAAGGEVGRRRVMIQPPTANAKLAK